MKVWCLQWATEVWRIFWGLIKLMLPILLVVRLIEVMGWIDIVGDSIEPLMVFVGLPGEMGLVLMTSIFSGLYAAMAVFYQIGGAEQLTVAQVSVLGTMILLAHGLPVEAAIAKATGVSLWFTLLLRVGGALILGALLNVIYSSTGALQIPIETVWQPSVLDTSWLGWFETMGQTLVAILFIIIGLTLCMRLLRYLGIEQLMHRLLAPVLRLLGIGAKASNVIIIGFTLGLAIGGSLLVQEARSGNIPSKDIFTAMAFLGLCHSLIEDTLLILLLGADISAILWARLAFGLIVVIILSRLVEYLPRRKQQWLYKSMAAK